MNLEKALETFGNGWVTELGTYLSDKPIQKIGQELYRLKSQGLEILPESNLIFRAFKETPYDKVTVVMLGQDPYPQVNVADGLAFSCSRSLYPQPSLKNICVEIDSEYPQYMFDPHMWRLDQIDLTRWTKQGVFLLNSALTVQTNKPGSHADLWRDFTIEIINKLNKKEELVYLLLGKISQSFEKYISTKHRIISAPHPASESYGHSGFYGSNCFKQVNECLESVNLTPINW